MTLEDFHADLMREVVVRADATADSTESAFAAVVSDYLLDEGVISDFVPCVVRQRGFRVDGYAFIQDEATLDLYVTDYLSSERIETLTKTAMELSFKRLEGFFLKSKVPDFVNGLEVAHPAWGLAKQIQEEASTLARVRFYLFTNRQLSSTVKELPTTQKDGCEWTYRVFDLGALQRLLSTTEPEEIIVDFEEMFGEPLVCLPAGGPDANSVDSYLAVIPGDWLAKIYDRFGGRLLEQNVRTFLQVRAKVNKGIRKTILEEPGMFFAYNNGISTTAVEADLELSGGVGKLHSVRHLQIVNGGQTTASIFNVKMKERGVNLSGIRVQMKLTIVPSSRVDEIVPRISQYSNSQNKISEADFFSNHPFHVRVESISRHTWAPAVGGSHIQTHWFYERARGQYVNQQAYLSPAKKREFQLQNPRGQVITKTDLAKVINTFRRLPYIVSLGAQKNFGHFVTFVNDEWKQDGVDFNDTWFHSTIAQTIIFKVAERLIQDAEWYALGYRAQTVTYTIALLQERLANSSLAIDTERIWLRQEVGPALKETIQAVAEQVQDRIIRAAGMNGIVNVTEWCKRKGCWEDVCAHVPVQLTTRLDVELCSLEDATADKKAARRERRMFNDVDAQLEVVNRGAEYWTRLLGWGNSGIDLSPSEIQVLRIAAAIPKKIPSPQQCMKLLEVEAKAKDEGFTPN